MARPAVHLVSPGTSSWKHSDGRHLNFLGVGSELHDVAAGTTRAKPKGWVPPTSYTLNHKFIINSRGTLSVDHGEDPSSGKRVTQEYRGLIGGGIVFNDENHYDQVFPENQLALDPNGLENAALIDALIQLKNQKVNLGVAWGERSKTAQLLGDTMTSIGRSFQQLRRGRFNNAARELGIRSKIRKPRGSNIPQQWLALQYGWKPLLSDVYGSVAALHAQEPSNWNVTAKGRKTLKDIKKTYSYQTTVNNVQPGFIATAEVTRSAFVRIDAISTGGAIMPLTSLGITNPLVVAWELVPFSFVIDWALPIGDYLNSLDAMIGYTGAWFSSSLKCKGKWTLSGASQSFSNGRYNRGNFGGRKEMLVLRRTPSSGFTLPSPPSFKSPASLTHMANALSLAAGIMTGKWNYYR